MTPNISLIPKKFLRPISAPAWSGWPRRRGMLDLSTQCKSTGSDLDLFGRPVEVWRLVEGCEEGVLAIARVRGVLERRIFAAS